MFEHVSYELKKANRSRSQGVSKLPPRLIQCAFGYELEFPNWHTMEAQTDEVFRQSPIPVGSSNYFERGTVLMRNRLMELQADDFLDNKSDLEIVSKPFDDSPQGFIELQQSLLMVRKIITMLKGCPGQLRLRELALKNLGGTAFPRTFVHYVPSRYHDVTAQVTAGLKLSRFSDMFLDFGIGGEMETERLHERRSYGRNVTGLDFSNKSDSIHLLTGSSVFLVEDGLDEFWQSEPSPPFALPSMALKSLLTIMLLYLFLGARRVSLYPKSFTRYLMRTDFSKLYRLLPDHEMQYFSEDGGKHWLRLFKILLDKKHIRKEPDFKRRHIDPLCRLFENPVRKLPLNGRFYSGGVYWNRAIYKGFPTNIMKALSRKDWIMGIPNGVDLLTRESFPDKIVAGCVGSMGDYGSKVDWLEGWELAPIFELRHVYWEGKPDIKGLFDVLLSLFAYFYALNRGINYKLGEPLPSTLTRIEPLQETEV
ncbi:MAG: hypothetical protein MI784_15420 [Cytophagales bacterium]|nr:hypothetical protein [Cytophagales bacterium]